MKAVVRNAHWDFTIRYDSKYNDERKLKGLEFDLLKIVYKQINMTFVHVPTPEGFELKGSDDVQNLVSSMIAKGVYIALGSVGTQFRLENSFDSTNPYTMVNVRWYVPCSVKYPRWSSIFRILSVEMWLVLIISIVTAAISTTVVGRYSCTSEWQGYKTLTSSLTNIWAVILGVSVPTIPRAPPLRSLFLPGFVSLWLSTQFSRHFSLRFLLTPVTKHQFKTWMSCSLLV
jgi:hypothetical protein